jgi:hypothetical protein
MSDEERGMAFRLQESGWGVFHPTQFRIDIEKEFFDIWDRVKGYTMTSVERGYALYKSVIYVIENRIEGSFVECGVWKGGSCMLCALTAKAYGDRDRDIYLYDTFTGMTEPSEHDRVAWNNRKVEEQWKENAPDWAAGLEEVKENMVETRYPIDKVHFVPGRVEETLKETVPEKISLLRLDTDLYESTKAELEALYPMLRTGGILIIDDYGHFTGAKKAVDDYFRAPERKIFLSRVDYTGRVGVKLT